MADQVVEKIKAMGGQAVADYGNVAKEEDANKMVQTAVEHFGKLDFLIANAGILRDKAFKNMTNEMWDIVLDVHLRGTYLTVRAAYNQMMNQESGGSIVVTSSTSGLLGNFGQTNYGAAKAGIAGFARCLFQEGMKYGIRVNVLAPAAWSRLTEDIFPQGQNMAELLSPDKVSPLVVWLGSDDAKDVTGRTFLASGNTVQLLSWQSQVICQKTTPKDPSALPILVKPSEKTSTSGQKAFSPRLVHSGNGALRTIKRVVFHPFFGMLETQTFNHCRSGLTQPHSNKRNTFDETSIWRRIRHSSR